jgi:hypothetical protein
MVKKQEETDIVKSDEQPLAGMPSYMQEAQELGRAGLEKMDQQDMVLPRLGLCQSMTPQRKKDDATYIKGLEEGQYFNTITESIYGDKIQVVPLLFFKTRFRFKPQTEGGGLLCQSRDYFHGVGDPGGDCERCPLARFTDGKKPVCGEYFNYAVLVLPGDRLPDMSSLAVLSFKSTGIKIARTWNGLMNMRTMGGKSVPSFVGVYDVTSAIQKNAAGQSWYRHVVRNAEKGWVSDPVFKLAKELHESIVQMQAAGKLAMAGTEDPDEVIDAESISPEV